MARVGSICTLATALVACVLLAAQAIAAPANGLDGPSCRTVRLSDVGWTDVTATTATFGVLLRELGYQPQITVLSVPVTFASMKNKDIDVFLGNWMPTQEGDIKDYLKDGSVEVIGANLNGAKYTLAVPAYTYALGLHDFADIQRFGPQLKYSIYGLEPGNDGDRLVLGMIKQNMFGLGNFKLVESSEQGMLAEVERAGRTQSPIVFLAWDPHPMNMRFDIRYLSGGDAVFGPNFGGANVFTNTRAGYSNECPNIGRLLRNLKFTPRGESQIMASMLDKHETPEAAAKAWLQANPRIVASWLAGVYTMDGRPALDAIRVSKSNGGWSFEQWISGHKIPVGATVAQMIEYVKTHGRVLFDGVSTAVRGSVNGLTFLLVAIPSWLLILAIGGLTWVLRRSVTLVVFVVVAMLFIMNQGYWVPTMETLSLVIAAALVSTVVGVPLGIAAAHQRNKVA